MSEQSRRPRRPAKPYRRPQKDPVRILAFEALRAVDGVSLMVPRGERRAIIGPNGAGKTTLFNTICGVFRPDGGTIAFAGERIDGHPPDEVCRRGIGRTFQLVRPFPTLSVEDNVVVGARTRCSGSSICSASGRSRPRP